MTFLFNVICLMVGFMGFHFASLFHVFAGVFLFHGLKKNKKTNFDGC